MTIAAIALAVVGLILLSLALAWLFGWLPARDGSDSPTAREARERTADTAAEFWDWLRLGR